MPSCQEYPVCWQTECNKGFADEKEGFTNLVKELSVAFRPRGLLLSTAVSPSKQIIDKGYDVPTLSEYFDWIAVMTYDFHGQWDKKTGHVAPLFEHPDDDISYFNAVSWQFIFYSYFMLVNCSIMVIVSFFSELLIALLDGEGSTTT